MRTPGPWTWVPHNLMAEPGDYGGLDSPAFAVCYGDSTCGCKAGITFPEDDDAKFVLLAVNAHDALVAACEAARVEVERVLDDADLFDEMGRRPRLPIEKQLRDALKLAER